MPTSTTYTVKPGDTLTRIATAQGVDFQQLVRLNNIANPNAIRVGQVLKLPGGGDAIGGGSPPPPVPAPANGSHVLGKLSSKFETSGRGPGTVSGGQGDRGGVSYGSYQLASKLNRPEEFLASEGRRWAAEFGGAKSGTAAFSAVWKAIAQRESQAFHDAQHDYIKRTHYDIQVRHVRARTGVDIDQRSNAVRDAVWSTAVQHGPSNNLVVTALSGRPADDRSLLNALYAERGRAKADGTLVHFSRNSRDVQRGCAQRFRAELADALKMLGSG